MKLCKLSILSEIFCYSTVKTREVPRFKIVYLKGPKDFPDMSKIFGFEIICLQRFTFFVALRIVQTMQIPMWFPPTLVADSWMKASSVVIGLRAMTSPGDFHQRLSLLRVRLRSFNDGTQKLLKFCWFWIQTTKILGAFSVWHKICRPKLSKFGDIGSSITQSYFKTSIRELSSVWCCINSCALFHFGNFFHAIKLFVYASVFIQ